MASEKRPGTYLAAVALLAFGAGLVAERPTIAAVINPPAQETAAVAPPPPTPTASLPNYELLTLVVPAGGSYRLTFPAWPTGTTLQGYFQVDAQDIGFQVQQPDGMSVVNLSDVAGRYDFTYTTNESGPYSMVFANGSDLRNDRQLVLVYRAYGPTNG